MGETFFWEREIVIAELTKGKELMLQLQKHFDPMKQLACQNLAVEILSSFDKSMSLLNGTALSGMIKSKGKEIIHPALSSSTAPQLESPHLLVDSSTKSCDRPSNYRKRKTVSRRKELVLARSGEEVPPEDGFSWRKYGNKNISGEKYPREYYRCARRSDKTKCAATKMVQRSETEESLTFKVSYGENHSCGQEKKNQNEELAAVQQTECDHEIEIEAGQGKHLDLIFMHRFQLQIVCSPSSPHQTRTIQLTMSSPSSPHQTRTIQLTMSSPSSPHQTRTIQLTMSSPPNDTLFNHDVQTKSWL